MPAVGIRHAALVLAGMHAVAWLPRLPGRTALFAVGAALVTILVARWRWRTPVLCIAAGAGLLLADAAALLDDRLAAELAGVDVDTVVRIVDFPQAGSVTRLLAEPVDSPQLPRRLRLSWYDPKAAPRLGDCYAMTLRLKRPRGFANPGRFDYEAWLMSRRIGATGYVRAAEIDGTCPPPGPFLPLRRHLAERIRDLLPGDDATAVLLAVTLGARQWIDDRRWEVFATTGTSHLMAISGMHVALAAGGVFLLARLGFALAGVSGNHRHFAAVAAVLFAGLYAMLSGLGVPARRALVMLLVTAFVGLRRRGANAWQVYATALLAVAASSPLQVLTAGFNLSFAAVALLLLLTAQRPWRSIDRLTIAGRCGSSAAELGALQVTLLLGLLPLTAAFFGHIAWLSPVANLLALPLFNVVALPAALIGAAWPGAIGEFMLLLAWRAMHWLLALLDGFAALPHADVRLPALGPFGWTAVLLAALTTLLPPGWPLRGLRWVALIALLARPPERPPDGCVDLDVLDVGQGLAAVLQTRHATVAYDAGPRFQSGSDTGRLVVLPFLAYRGIDRLDLLVVSHADLDHAGGTESILGAVPTGLVLSGEPHRGPLRSVAATACAAGQLWNHDGIGFAVLHPPAGSAGEGNNASCVLEVRAGTYSLLLTGDIEADAERDLLRRGLLQAATVVVVPHHGSKTSSHPGFVRRLAPRLAIASAGFDNRWGMPRPDIVRRWQAEGANFLDTGKDGAIGVRLCAESGTTLRYRARDRYRRFWHEP